MALIKCKECGKEVSSQAKRCPHCGAKLKTGFFTKFVGAIIGLFVILWVIGSFIGDGSTGKPHGSTREDVIKKELSYLNDVSEVSWYEVDDNNVYIGFSPVPSDWDLIVRGAALRANKAIDFGAHAWGLRASQRGWRPGDGPYLGAHTARYGRITD